MFENESLVLYKEGDDLTGVATADVVGKTFVDVSANIDSPPGTTQTSTGDIKVATCAAGAKGLGVAKYDGLTGALVGIHAEKGRICQATAGGTIVAGEELMVGTGGKVVPLGDVAAIAASLATGVVGNNNALTWTARDAGDAGNGISVRLLDPAANSQALAVTVAGNDITVSLATNGGGAITSTAAQVAAAIAASAAANALVSVANTSTSTGAGVVVATAATNLAGGRDPRPGRSVAKAVSGAANNAPAWIQVL